MTLYIGVMSGTSLDGVDAVLVRFGATDAEPMHLIGHAHQPFSTPLKAELLALNSSGADELHRAALAANALARTCSEVVRTLLASTATPTAAVRAIGAHGQTVRHRPRLFDGIGYTLQLNAPALLAELVAIDVVADFRSRDVAAGGIGAPLVPAFHRALFGRVDMTVAVLNIGGICNVTVLHRDGRTIGFDCGPGNALMDFWCESRTGRAFDAQGCWAASGRVIEPLLAAMLADRFFATPPPKSTGRDDFNASWLARHLQAFTGDAPKAADVQATLCELTARSCANEVRRHAVDARELLVCGGGALNDELMRRLAAQLPAIEVSSTDRVGLAPTRVEASAFAWLARAFVEGRTGSLAAVTGARGPRILGALYPAGSADAAGEAMTGNAAVAIEPASITRAHGSSARP